MNYADNINGLAYFKGVDSDQTYVGQDLTLKFADEISGYSDEWAWIKARKTAGNYAGLHVSDYIPVTFSNGYLINMQIMGMNTYTNYGSSMVGNHIDFIGDYLWNDLHVMNQVNYNNGNANSPNPFLASDLNYWLNSMSGDVPYSTTDPATTVVVDYTEDGVLYYMPEKVTNQIIVKHVLMPSRYTSGSVISSNTTWAWQNTGKLWIPSEMEVCGTNHWGDSTWDASGYVQYPYFANNMARDKKRCVTKGRHTWWLSSARSGNSTNFAYVGSNGNASYNSASYTSFAAPVCFRI